MKRTGIRKNMFRPSLLILLGFTLISTMIAQLTFLSFFGTRGKEVATIRQDQKNLILENELIEANINKMQSLDRIKKVASENFGMMNVGNIQYISPNTPISFLSIESEK